MCDVVSGAMFGLNTLGRIAGHSAAKKSAKYRNRARLAKYEAEKSQYLHEVTLNDAQYKNDVSIQEGNQDRVYQAMVDQWVEQDNQLDKIFNDGRFQIMDSLVNSYQNDYAGSGAGVTAGRLAAESVRRHGHEKAKLLSQMMLAKDHAYNNMEAIRNRSDSKSMELYEAVRFAPIHGPTPIAPELEAIPGSSSLLLGIATDALGGYMQSKLFKAPDVFSGKSSSKALDVMKTNTTVGNLVESAKSKNVNLGVFGGEVFRGDVVLDNYGNVKKINAHNKVNYDGSLNYGGFASA